MALQAAGSFSAGTRDAGQLGPAEVAELLLVALAVLQGLALGIWMGAAPGSVLTFCGLGGGATLFVRWAGALQLALALAYAIDFLRRRRIALLLAAKGASALLLVGVALAEGLPHLALVAVALDATFMGFGAVLQAPAERSRRARVRLHLVVGASPSRSAGGR